MSAVSRLSDLLFGLHASATDFTGTPTHARILPRGAPSGLFPPSREEIDRDLFTAGGQKLAHVFGRKKLNAITVPMEFRGVNANTGAASTWQAKMEQATMLDSIFGAAAAASVGAATTCSGTAGATLTVASGTNIANGDMIMFTTSTGTFIREVTSGGGTVTLTLDRVASGTASGTVLRAARWNWDTSITDVIHGGFRSLHHQEMRGDFVGCGPQSLELTIPNAGLVEMSTTWLPSDYTPGTTSIGAFAEPTAGNPIVNAGSVLSIGAVSMLVRNMRISLDNGLVPRESGTVGPNGVVGYVCSDRRAAMLEGELYIGSNTGTIGELTDTSTTPSSRTLLGIASGQTASTVAGTFDVSLQVGTVAGQAFYVRIPAADIVGDVVSGGAFSVFKFSAKACLPASGTPFRLGVL